MKLVRNLSATVVPRSAQAALCLLIGVAFSHVAQAAHKVTTFDPPGAGTSSSLQGTFPIQNLNSGVIVGYFVDAKNVAHGFIRRPHGKYTTIDVPGAAGTQALGINDEGTVVGWWFDAKGMYHGYLRDAGGNFTSFDVPGAAPAQGQSFPGATILFPLAINRLGTVTGSYVDGKNPPMFHCFVRSPDGNVISFDPAGSVGTIGDTFGINRAGAISGGYTTADGVVHGFVRDPEGAISSFNAPLAGTKPCSNCNFPTGTTPNMITDAGTIPGVSWDDNQVQHAFIRYSDRTFVTFDAAGAGTRQGQGTIAGATNLAGTTAGNYIDAKGLSHGLVRSHNGRITTYDVPGVGTGLNLGIVAIASINDEGAVVGWYPDANGANHGFIYQSEDDD